MRRSAGFVGLALLLTPCAGCSSGSTNAAALDAPPTEPTLEFVGESTDVLEGEVGTLRVRLRIAERTIQPYSVTLRVASSDANLGADYLAVAETRLTFAAGSADGATKEVLVHAFDDDAFEGEFETVWYELVPPDDGSATGLVLPASQHPVRLIESDVVRLGFRDARRTVLETDAALQAVQVELDVPAGVRLAVPVRATIGERAASTAAFADVVLQTRSVEFLPDDDALVRDVVLNVIDDGVTEPDETLELELVSETPGVALARSLASLVITDRVASAPALAAKRDGVGVSLDAALSFGRVALGDESVIELELTNRGAAPLSIGFPFLADWDAFFRVEFVDASASARVASEAGGPGPSLDTLRALPAFACDADLARRLDPFAAALDDGRLPAVSPETWGAQPTFLRREGGVAIPTLRVAIETDNAFYGWFGDTAAATAWVARMIEEIDVITRRDLGIALELVYVGLYPDAPDPWVTPDELGTPAQMLAEFQRVWVANGWPVEADIAHFLSGAPLGGGAAYVASYCSALSAFGAAGNMTGQLDWSRFDGTPSQQNWELYVVAHEIGHSLGGVHTQDYCPPLDRCGLSCSGIRQCETGTLMSYCGQCIGGAQNIELRFHPTIANSIRHTADFSCLPRRVLDPGASQRLRLVLHPDVAGALAAPLTIAYGELGAATAASFELLGIGGD